MMLPDVDKWFYRPAPDPNAKMRLFCFHYAGGSAQIYRKWGSALKSVCEVVAIQLPGRGSRIGEKLYTRVDDLIHDFYPIIAPLLDKPYAMYGHSLGAQVAFELTRKVASQKVREPLALYFASRVAPDMPPDNDLLSLADEGFIKGMTARYGANAGMGLMDDPEIRALFLPTLRADMQMYGNYLYTGKEPLPYRVFTLLGKTDIAIKPDHMAGWKKITSGAYEFHQFNGGHFFWQEEDSELMSFLKASLSEL